MSFADFGNFLVTFSLYVVASAVFSLVSVIASLTVQA